MFGKLMLYLGYLNNSKFFAGLVMIMLNIGSKYITVELSKSQEQYLKNHIGRQILIFAISWMGSRDILIALALTAVFTILADHLFNEESKYCVIPKKYRQYEHLLDMDKNNVVTDDEIKKAQEILEKANKKEQKRNQLRHLNDFMLQV
ncbi:MAG: hypothetical protein CL678_05685 [Bdellovibrionaceae bacterium]|nr:hypothetical protein [Pseudobdellovibrionaceae bacterium]|tara:strand:+ start:550 stop:993 length:444 start_codon:yes stop_codon:yes gene_type:complete